MSKNNNPGKPWTRKVLWVKEKEKSEDKPWTKKELSLRVGYVELAKAVVEQWKKDGQPESELIPFWIGLIEEAKASKDRRSNG